MTEHQSQKNKGWKAASDVSNVKEKSFEGDPKIRDFFFAGQFMKMVAGIVLGKSKNCQSNAGNLDVPSD